VTTVVQLAGVAALAAVGWPLVGALAAGARGLVERVSLAIWLGYAPLTLTLFLVGLVVPYGRATAILCVLVAAGATVLVRVRLGATADVPAPMAADALVSPRADRLIALAAGAATLVLLAQPVVLAVRGLPVAYDFYAIWGFDAKVFFVRGTPAFVHGFNHAYYPAAAPFHHLFLDLLAGRASSGLQLLPSALEFAALVGVTRYLARRLGAPPALGSLVGLLVCAGASATIFSALSGYGDLPLTAGLTVAAGAGVIWLRGDDRALLLSAAGAALAAWSKFEGLPSVLLVLAAVLAGAHALGRGELRRAAATWLAVVAAAIVPWWAFVASEGVGGGREHVSRLYLEPGFILSNVGRVLVRPGDFALWWPLMLGLLALTAPAWWRAGAATRTLVLLTLAELVAVLSAYVVSSHAGSVQDVRATAPRLYVHWMPTVALAVACGVAAAVRAPREPPGRTN
jgi:hypothetical protein